MTTIRLIILILITDFVHGQTDSTCRLNSSGKKIGYCKVYLDDKAMLTDSINSYFWGYEFYDNGKTPFDRFLNGKDVTRYKIIYDGTLPKKGTPVPIDGIIKWFLVREGKEEIYLEDTYKNGYAQIFKQYDSEGKAWVTCDFTKLYMNTPGTLWMEYAEGVMSISFQKKGKGWVMKKGKKWKYVKVK